MRILVFFLIVFWSVPVVPEAAPCDARSAVLKAMERLSPNNARLWPAQIRLKNLSSGEQTLLVIRKGLWPIKS